MNCPICNRRRLFRRWEQSQSHWWTGKYECPRCGTMKCSGVIRKEHKVLTYWHPSCLKCGLDPVVKLHDIDPPTFLCTECGTRIIAQGGAISRHFRGTRTHQEHTPPDATLMWNGIEEAACR